MNLQEAESRAKYLTEIRKQSHVIIETNKQYHVCMKSEWKGKAIKQIDYENTSEPKETKSKKDKSVPKLLDSSSEAVLSSDGGE